MMELVKRAMRDIGIVVLAVASLALTFAILIYLSHTPLFGCQERADAGWLWGLFINRIP
jgi:hypothetical protein